MTDAVAAAAAQFAADALEPRQWSNAAGDRYGEHLHERPKLLICVAGTITFHTPDGDIELRPGDRLDLPAGMPHAATVGPSGVTCLEAFR